jgi:hypothetical protein
MPLAAGIFDQSRIAWAEAAYGSVSETYFQFAGYQNDVLSAWCGMPVDKSTGRLLGKYDMLCGLRFTQHWVVSELLFFQVRLTVTAGVHPENCHDDLLSRTVEPASTNAHRPGERLKEHGGRCLRYDDLFALSTPVCYGNGGESLKECIRWSFRFTA